MINLDGLLWVSYKDTEWTIANRTTDNRNHYHNKKGQIVGGLELVLAGTELAEYKALHLAAHGESLKCPRLIVLDRQRVEAYKAFIDGHNTPSPDTSVQSVGTTMDSTPLRGGPVIQEDVPHAVLKELIKVTESKGLHWVKYEGSVYLAMAEASKAKGMEKDDYSSNWQGGQLPGIGKLLQGSALEAFRSIYIKDHGSWPFPHTKSLCIGNWEHAYAYLVQGKSPTATTFQSMGAHSIQHTIVGAAPQCPESWSSEEDLVDRVFKLMELSTISMQREACFFNTLGNTPTTRRVDAIEHIPGEDGHPPKVHVYEFKKQLITSASVSETVGTKGYIHLVREKYPEAKVCLFMVGNNIDPQAQRLLDCMLGVMYLPLSTLLNRILASIVQSWPREGQYQLRTHFLSRFQDILPTEMLSGPIAHPQIIATYHKPVSLKSTAI